MQKNRAFLKWPGNKYRVLDQICAQLPSGKCLIEPFVGSAVVFLNTHYPAYSLSDANADLINTYLLLQQEGKKFIEYTKKYFIAKNNQANQYYHFRELFNHTTDIWQKSALFIYLNRHGYNGLCRYNQKGKFNVPFGRYLKPYFPEQEMLFFHTKAQKNVKFTCIDFRESLKKTKSGQVVYCDPPYVPLSSSANFTSYNGQIFSFDQQKELADMAELLVQKGISVLISNHDTSFTRQIYQGAEFTYFPVKRMISCKSQHRVAVKELLALYT